MGYKYGGGGGGGGDGEEEKESRAEARRRGWEGAGELVRAASRSLEYLGRETRSDGEKEGEEEEREAAGGGSAATTTTTTTTDTETKKKKVPPPSPDVRLLYLSSLLLPFRSLSYGGEGGGGAGKSTSVPAFMLREGVKFRNRDVSSVDMLLGNVDEMSRLMGEYRRESVTAEGTTTATASATEGITAEGTTAAATTKPPLDPVETGMLIRKLGILWPTCVYLATALEVHGARELSTGGKERGDGIDKNDDKNEDDDDGGSDGDAVLRSASRFVRTVLEQNLDRAHGMRPLLDGRALMKELALSPGPNVGLYAAEVVRWMLRNPDGKRDECLERMRDLNLSSEEDP